MHAFIALNGQCCMQEEQQGWRYDYYVFCDDDIHLIRPNVDQEFSAEQSLRQFEAKLMRWQPAVGSACFNGPACSRALNPHLEEVISTYHSDHIMIAFQHDSLHELWPLNDNYDQTGCWHVSQWAMTNIASMHFAHHYLIDTEFVVQSSQGRDYPHDSCMEKFCLASMDLVSKAPVSVLPCVRPMAADISGVECLHAELVADAIRKKGPEYLQMLLFSDTRNLRHGKPVIPGHACVPAYQSCRFGEARPKSARYTLHGTEQATLVDSGMARPRCQLWPRVTELLKNNKSMGQSSARCIRRTMVQLLQHDTTLS